MTYEEFLKLTKKNLKRFFPESFQERKVEIMEVLKNNNIKLQGVYLPGTKSYTSVPLLYLESYYQELEDGKKLEDVWQKIAQDYQKCRRLWLKRRNPLSSLPIRERRGTRLWT